MQILKKRSLQLSQLELLLNGPVPWLLYLKKMEHPDLLLIYKDSMHNVLEKPNIAQLASQVPPNFKKNFFETVDGHHAIPLHPDSQPLTTFRSEWGYFHYLRMPLCFVPASDGYNCRFNNIVAKIPRKVKIIDDTLLHSIGKEQTFYNTWDFLTTCANNYIVTNKKKSQFYQDTVPFEGLTITNDSLAPSESILSSIKNFPVPTNIISVRSWSGLINQVSWAYSISPMMKPFRDLL